MLENKGLSSWNADCDDAEMIYSLELLEEHKSTRPLDLRSMHDHQDRFMGSVSPAPRRKRSRSECDIGDWVAVAAVSEWSTRSQRQTFNPDGTHEHWTFVRGLRREEAGELAVWVRF